MTFLPSPVEECWSVCPVCPADIPPPPRTHKSCSYGHTLLYTPLHLHLLPPLVVLMALLPGSCPEGTWSACCYLSLVGWSCLSLPSPPPRIHTSHPSPCSDPASAIAFSGCAGAAHILCPHGIHQHMYAIVTGCKKAQIMQNHAWTYKSKSPL